MVHTGICPHCQKRVVNVKIEDVDIKVGLQSQWRGFSYQCPSCKCILGVQMNPITLNKDLEDDILREVKKMFR